MPDLKKSAELVGLIAVVVSLLFLGYEQKRANDIAEAEAIASMMAEFNGFVSLITSDDELWRIWSQGDADYESLSDDDKARYAQLVSYVFNVYEMSFAYIENGLVDDQFVQYFTRDFCALLNRNDGVGRFWEWNRDDRAQGLAVFAQSNCVDGAE